MKLLTRNKALDRHALVMTIWLSFGFVAVVLLDYGLHAGGTLFIFAAFGAILAAFVGHIIVNTVYETTFTSRELALGLVLYAAALVAFGVTTVVSATFVERSFLPLGLGLVILAAIVIFYMVVHFGVRRAFEGFDVIRDFKPQRETGSHPGRGVLR